MSLRALIVEDEELARQRLKILLAEHADALDIIGECSDGLSAIETINREKPDVIFLDIQMPGCDGFEVLARIEHDPKVIFTTAYDQYAIQAFETNSVAYLLKPIDREKLSKAVEKLGGGSAVPLNRLDLVDKLSAFLNKQEDRWLKRIQVRVGDRILLLGLDEILFFESEDKYTTVVTEKKRHVIDTPLIELEERLDPEKFTRVHRSCIVNIDWIAEIHRHVGGKLQVQLRDQTKTILTVSRSYVDRVRNL